MIIEQKTGQTIHRFDNGYGASVVSNDMAYGGLELAVLRFPTESDRYELCYDTDVTDNVIGWLDDEKLADLLTQIESL